MSNICRIFESRILPALTKQVPSTFKNIENCINKNHFRSTQISELFICKSVHFSGLLNDKNTTSVSNRPTINQQVCKIMDDKDSSHNRGVKRKKKHLGWLLAGCCFSKKKNKTKAEVEESSPLLADSQNVEFPAETSGDFETRVNRDLQAMTVERPVCLLEKPSLPTVTLKSLDQLVDVDCHPGISGEASSKGVIKKSTSHDRPNHFVAIQVNCPEIHKALKLVQDSIIQRKPTMKSALNSLPTLHITLVVMNISDELDLQRATEALIISYDKIKAGILKKPLVLEFEGLSSFKHKVLFAEVKEGESYDRFKSLYEDVVTTYEAHGFDVREKGSWTPHLTIAKLSNIKRHNKKAIRVIDPSWYAEHKKSKFGCQPVNSLQLLSMTEKKDDQGYYQCKQECFFTGPVNTMDIDLQKKKEVREKIRLLTSDVLKSIEK